MGFRKIAACSKKFLSGGVVVLLLIVGAVGVKGQGALREKAAGYSDALVVAPGAKNVEYTVSGGGQHVTYKVEAEYPAEDLLKLIREKLETRGWKPLAEDFLNPGLMSSHSRGWARFQDVTTKPKTRVNQWLAQWAKDSGELAWYTLLYRNPVSDEPNLKTVEVHASYFSAESAQRMKKSVEEHKAQFNPPNEFQAQDYRAQDVNACSEALSKGHEPLQEGKWKEGEPHFRTALGAAEKGAGGPDCLVRALTDLAMAREILGAPREAEELLKRAIDVAEAQKDDSIARANLPNSYAALGRLYGEERKIELAEEYFGKAIALAKQADDFIGLSLIGFHRGLAWAYAEVEQYKKAERHYLEALRIAEQDYGKEDPEIGEVLSSLSNFYLRVGETEKAEQFARRLTALREKEAQQVRAGEREKNDWSGDTADAQRLLAWTLQRNDKAGEAEATLRASIAELESESPKRRTQLATAYQELAQLLTYPLGCGGAGEPDALFRQALEVLEGEGAKENERMLEGTKEMVWANFAEFLRGEKKFREAEEFTQRLITSSTKRYGIDDPETASYLVNLANVYRDEGRFPEAEPIYRMAIDVYERKLGEEKRMLASALDDYAELLKMTGREKEGKKLKERAKELWKTPVITTRHM